MKTKENFNKIFDDLKQIYDSKGKISQDDWNKLVRQYNKDDGDTPSKNYILEYIKKNNIPVEPELLEQIKMKPTRTASGVTPITIFTKPYRCSGNCIFCPTSHDAPKSYLPEEPGIQRALHYEYDPYMQVKGRIKALQSIGHNTSKIELIISGGTWDDYELKYQIWYMCEVFRALNDLESSKNSNLEILKQLQDENQHSLLKNVGICIETRPDKIDVESLKMYRTFGITKVQIGIQSLDDKVLSTNNRQHTLKNTQNALDLLRLAGFKIHIHWMCNLYSSNIKLDFDDFKKLFSNKHIKPDEIKIYPCSVLKNTELCKLFEQGKYLPYTTLELTELLIKCKNYIPRYCRINRLIRDIPSNLIVEGNKVTNLRQNIQEEMKNRKLKCKCIRCREVKNANFSKLTLKITKYKTAVSTEYFLEYITPEDKIASLLRLSVYSKKSLISDVYAMIRELHVYGTSLNLNEKSQFSTQHIGLGTQLLINAEKIAKKEKKEKIGVISAVGTRGYYKKRGYNEIDEYGYLIKNLL